MKSDDQSQNVQRAKNLAPDSPWNQTNIDDLGPCIMKWMDEHEPFYKRWAETWYNNFQFVYGNQNLRWSKRWGYVTSSNFSDFLQRLPAINQRAQTNISRIVLEALSSMIYANLPEWDVNASDESSVKGKRMKRIIQKLLDAYMVRLCCDVEIANAARSFTAFGQFAFKIDWNQMGGHQISVPRWMKKRVPIMTDYMSMSPVISQLLDIPTQALDANGQPLFEDTYEPVLDAMGQQIIDKFFAGDVRIKVLTPFEYRRRIDSTGMHNTRNIVEIKLLDYDQFLDEYANTPGRTKYWSMVQPIYSNPLIYRIAVQHYLRLQFTTPPELSSSGNSPDNIFKNSIFKSKVLVIEYYDAPHPVKWPLGRRVVVCNGQVTNVTVPQYSTGKLDGWHPFIEAQWLSISPSSMAIGPMNDVVAKNKELNLYDSLVATASRRNLGSQLLVTPGKGFDPQRFTGEPGIIHEVLDVYGARWLHDDMPIPPVIPQLRQGIKDDVFDVSGAGDALRGERSAGISSGYGQRIVEEREERRLSPPRKIFEKAVAGMGEKLVCCLKSNIVELDQNVMGYLIRAAAGEYTPADVVAFLSSPLSFGVEINVEADSMHLRSKATEQATINDMAQGNPAVQQRLQQNPKALDEFLKYFGAEVLRDDTGVHRDRAQRENEQFMDLMRLGPQGTSSGVPVVIYADKDEIHLQEHQDFLLQHAEEILANPRFYQFILEHINRHMIQLSEKGGAQAPGTSLQTPFLMAQLGGTPPPNPGMLYQGNQAKQQQQAMAAQAQQGTPQQPPPASAQGAQRPAGPTGPKAPAPMGSGGPPQPAPGTPAANHSAAKRGLP